MYGGSGTSLRVPRTYQHSSLPNRLFQYFRAFSRVGWHCSRNGAFASSILMSIPRLAPYFSMCFLPRMVSGARFTTFTRKSRVPSGRMTSA